MGTKRETSARTGKRPSCRACLLSRSWIPSIRRCCPLRGKSETRDWGSSELDRFLSGSFYWWPLFDWSWFVGIATAAPAPRSTLSAPLAWACSFGCPLLRTRSPRICSGPQTPSTLPELSILFSWRWQWFLSRRARSPGWWTRGSSTCHRWRK